MSEHYSKFDLNTSKNTPYFHAHLPSDYPLESTLVKCRAFRRLPPNLRKLCLLSKKWQEKNQPPGITEEGHWGSIEQWYDEAGYELNPYTGNRLTDEEIDAQWPPNPKLDKFKVEDISVPEGGFADPDTWQEPERDDGSEEDLDAPTEESLLRDIESHGREYVAKYYGVSPQELVGTKNDRQLALKILSALERTRP